MDIKSLKKEYGSFKDKSLDGLTMGARNTIKQVYENCYDCCLSLIVNNKLPDVHLRLAVNNMMEVTSEMVDYFISSVNEDECKKDKKLDFSLNSGFPVKPLEKDFISYPYFSQSEFHQGAALYLELPFRSKKLDIFILGALLSLEVQKAFIKNKLLPSKKNRILMRYKFKICNIYNKYCTDNDCYECPPVYHVGPLIEELKALKVESGNLDISIINPLLFAVLEKIKQDGGFVYWTSI